MLTAGHWNDSWHLGEGTEIERNVVFCTAVLYYTVTAGIALN
jgi:hypothetical protein